MMAEMCVGGLGTRSFLPLFQVAQSPSWLLAWFNEAFIAASAPLGYWACTHLFVC